MTAANGPPGDGLGVDGGWTASTHAWLRNLEDGDTNREVLLDPVMLAQAGDVSDLRVLDLGCGEGRFSRLLAARGARTVGLDPIEPMLAAARQRAGPSQAYLLATAECSPLADESIDLVVAYLSLIDIADYRGAIAEASRVLRRGGRLLAANISNLFSSVDAWVKDKAGNRLYIKVEDYLTERSLELTWSGIHIRNWHRPLSAYMDAYLSAGFSLQRYLEPQPADASLREDPRYEDWFRVPNFDVMVWQKL